MAAKDSFDKTSAARRTETSVFKLTSARARDALLWLGTLVSGGNDLPPLAGLGVDRNVRRLEPIVEPYEKQRIKLIKAYDNQDERGNYSVPTDKQDEFSAAHDPLAQEEHDVELYVIMLSDVLGGVYRDPATGQAGPLRFVGAALGGLEELGILRDDTQ